MEGSGLLMKVLITGGSGFLGRELTRQLYDSCERIVIYSRSEARQAEMKAIYPEYPDNRLRYYLGDVRDVNRLSQAMRGCDTVIHAAAQKRVETCALDVGECVRTNIIGTWNVANACVMNRIRKAIFVSSDKSVDPITTYGKSKSIAEDVWIQSNNLHPTKFSCVRYANVQGSTGSLLQIWKKQIESGMSITITDKRMSRMWLTVEDASKHIMSSLSLMTGGEIILPVCQSASVWDMARSLVAEDKIEIVGMRPYEKLAERMICEGDARECYYLPDKKVFVIYPTIHDWVKSIDKQGIKVPEDFRYDSDKIEEVMTWIGQIQPMEIRHEKCTTTPQPLNTFQAD
jgi:UDP-N-acetylglucosamine 4,6-dehydratase